MAVPPNTTIGTAIVIPSLPYSTTQDILDGTTNYTVWYQYTALATDRWLSLFGFGDLTHYRPRVTVWVSATQPYSLQADNVPLQFVVVPGTTYYLKFQPNTLSAGTSLLTVSLRSFGAMAAAPVGSIWINDDTNTFPLVLISATDGHVLQEQHHPPATPLSHPSFPWGEMADVLPTGEVLLQDRTANHLKLYTPAITLAADLPYGNDPSGLLFWPIRRGINQWFVGNPVDATASNHATVTTVTQAGIFGPTTWTLPEQGLNSLAPDPTDSILYYSGQLTDDGIVHRWDLVNDTALSDLAAAPGAFRPGVNTIIVLSDGTIVVGYRHRSSVLIECFIVRYAPDGTVLNTYASMGNRDFRIAYALDDPVSFWAWTKRPAGISRFLNIKASDGSSLTSFDVTEYEKGVYAGAQTATPTARFGASESCPFLIIPVGFDSPTDVTGTIDVTLPLGSGSDVALDAALTGYRLPPRHDELLCQVIMTIASLAPDARQRMFNSLGVILSGAKLQTYEAGTTTPLATYSDSALTVPNSNPVIADSSGLFGPIYLLAQSYKFVLYDSNNLLVWSQDNVWDVGELLQATITALTASVAANLALTQTKFCTTAFSQATSASLANIIGLTGFTLTAGGVYKFDINLAGTSGASGGVKYAFKYTTATLTNLEASGIGTTVSAVACQNATSTTDQATLYGQTAAVLNTRITGRITVNVGGTLAVQAAQNASDGTATTVAVGSWATFTKVS